MDRICFVFKLILISMPFIAVSVAHADAGDNAAVAKARKDYAEALQSKDIGRINAMKIELSVQLAKERDKAAESADSKHTN